jgi:hypothetical protein
MTNVILTGVTKDKWFRIGQKLTAAAAEKGIVVDNVPAAGNGDYGGFSVKWNYDEPSETLLLVLLKRPFWAKFISDASIRNRILEEFDKI